MTNLRDIFDLTCDFDGVFYPIHALKEANKLFGIANVKAIRELIPSLTERAAWAVYQKGFTDYHDSVTYQTKFAARLGFNPYDFRKKLFELHNKYAFQLIAPLIPHVLQPDIQLKSAFDSTKEHLRMGIATHGCTEHWVQPILRAKEVDGYIEPEASVCLADNEFVSKAIDSTMVNLCFNRLKAATSGRGYVEDTVPNLKVAKEGNPELTTFFIHHGIPLEQKPSYVDYQFYDLAELHRAIATAKANRHLIMA